MIRAVFLDAIKTIFSPYPSEAGLYKNVIEKITGIVMTEEELAPILAAAMAETELLDSVKTNSIQQWEHYPTKIAELIGCEKTECKEIGDKLRYETWGNPMNYRLYDDVLPTLKSLQEANVFVACVSNEDGWLSNFFDHFEIRKYFRFILTSQEVGYEKPNPIIFQEALDVADIEPVEVLFVGDSVISDYYGSKAVGMKPLLIDREHKNQDDSVVSVDNLEKLLEYVR